jgi:hypothetical protein
MNAPIPTAGWMGEAASGACQLLRPSSVRSSRRIEHIKAEFAPDFQAERLDLLDSALSSERGTLPVLAAERGIIRPNWSKPLRPVPNGVVRAR